MAKFFYFILFLTLTFNARSQKAFIGDSVPFSVSNEDNFPNSNAGYYLLNTKFEFDAIVYGFETYLNSSGMIAVSFEKADECLNDTEYSKCIQTNSSELNKCNKDKICFKQFGTRLIKLNCCFNNYTYATPFFVPKGSMVYINQDDKNGMTGKVAIDRSGKAQYSDLVETYSNGFSNLSKINSNYNWKLFFRVLVEPINNATKPTTLSTTEPKICLNAGYYGENCDQPKLRCLKYVCLNETNCHNYANYDCKCLNNECRISNANPSYLNGAYCSNNYLPNYSCSCKDLRKDLLICDSNFYLNQCLSPLSNPCQNEKNCHHLVSQYGFHPTCTCQQQETCFKNTTHPNPCSQQTCLEDSICKSLIVPNYQNSFTCECRNGSNECFESSSACNNLCKNGATCYMDIDLNVPFCWCRPGTTGKYCQYLEGCYEYYQTGYKCKNNGTCFQSADDYFHQRYECKCQNGFGGTNCENKTTDACLSNPCLNKATCQENQIQNELKMGYKCICSHGFGGENCQYSFFTFKYLIESFFRQILKIIINIFNYLI